MNLILSIKQFIYTKPYFRLYPLSENDKAVEKINNLDINDGSQFSEDIQSLIAFIFSDMAKDDINKDKYERSLKGCYKTKRVKIKDEEADTKVIEKVRMQKRGVINKNDVEHYNDKLDEIENNSNTLSQLAERLVDGNIRKEDLPLCDKILKQNKFSWRFYVAIIVIVIIAIVVAFLI